MNSTWPARLLCWLAVTALLIAVRWEIIASPPYYDFAIGLWVEADYLAESGFDYWGLRYREVFSMGPHGGRRSYMTSVMPTVAALLMRFLPGHQAPLVAYHLLVLACGGAALTTFARLCEPRVGRWAAWGLTATVATTPVFCVQLDMLGFEIPLIAAAVAAIAAAARGQWSRAAAWSCLAFLVKPTGMLIAVGILAFQAVAWLAQRVPATGNGAGRRLDVRWRQFLAPLGFLCVQIALLRWAGSVEGQMRSGPPLFMLLFWCPDVLIVGLLCAAAGGWKLMRRMQAMHRAGTSGRLTTACTTLASHPEAALGSIVAAMVLAGITQVVFIPRYAAVLVPLVYLAAAPVLFPQSRRRVFGTLALTTVIALNLANWNGALLPRLSWVNAQVLKTTTIAREGSFLERSHEYLADHHDNLATVEFLATHCRDDDIFAGVPFNIALALPRLGYLKPGRERSRPGYSNIGFQRITARWHEAADAVELLPRRAVMTRTDNVFNHYLNHFIIDEPGPDDEVLLARPGPSRLAVYRPAWTKRPISDDALREWYVRRLRPEMLADDTKERLAPWLSGENRAADRAAP